MIKIIIAVFILMNIIGFAVCFSDKRAAIKDRWRVPEKRLFLIGLLWGATGIFLGMLVFRHKTRHWYFMIGMPLLMCVNYFTLYKILEIVGGITL